MSLHSVCCCSEHLKSSCATKSHLFLLFFLFIESDVITCISLFEIVSEQRVEESQDIMAKYPDRVPVRPTNKSFLFPFFFCFSFLVSTLFTDIQVTTEDYVYLKLKGKEMLWDHSYSLLLTIRFLWVMVSQVIVEKYSRTNLPQMEKKK